MKKRLLCALGILTLAILPLTGCANDNGPAEEMGENINEAVNEVTDN